MNNQCEVCGTKGSLLFHCNYCGGYFCAEHRLPEGHDCINKPKVAPLHMRPSDKKSHESSIRHYHNRYHDKYNRKNQKRSNIKRGAIKVLKAIIIISILVGLAVIIIPPAQSMVLGNSSIIGFSYHALRNPTYDEMTAFITIDRTNEHVYSFPDYVCEDFSRDTQYNAMRAGYRCGIVRMQFEGGQSFKIGNTIYENGHAIICFDTSDQGLVFIEPQHDETVKIMKDYSFSQLNNYIQMPNDIIESYSISWIVIDLFPK